MGNFGGGRPHGRRRFNNAPRGPRRNDRIRVPEIRVIGPDGTQVGVMPTRQALSMAKNAGLDLVEISPNAQPPVCRILDYGKFKYEESKKQKSHKPVSTKLKEVKFRVRTDTHDYEYKLRHAEEFLDKGNKVKLSLQFRGRENEYKELGLETIRRAVKDLDHIGHEDAPPRLVGRNVSVTVSPLPANKRKLKWTLVEFGGDREPGQPAPKKEDAATDSVTKDKVPIEAEEARDTLENRIDLPDLDPASKSSGGA